MRRCKTCGHKLDGPLRFVVKSINTQRLLDVTEEQANKAGYENVADLHNALCSGRGVKKRYLSDLKKAFKPIKEEWDKGNKFEGVLSWNPEVWVLEFKVKKRNE